VNASVASLWGASAPRFFSEPPLQRRAESCVYANTRCGRFWQGLAVEISDSDHFYFDPPPPNVNPIDAP
jgi:hypothetical protein